MNFIFRLRLFIGGELSRLASWMLPEVDGIDECENRAEWMLISDKEKPTFSCSDCLSSMVTSIVADGIFQIDPINYHGETCCFVFGEENLEQKGVSDE